MYMDTDKKTNFILIDIHTFFYSLLLFACLTEMNFEFNKKQI